MLRIAALLLALSLAMPARAQSPLHDGWTAYTAKDYATAFRLWQPLADAGNGWAQLYVGIMYEEGQSVAQDYAQAVKWYRLAAEQGDAWAQHRLALMYEHGRGIPQDHAEAHKWLNLAASRYPATEKDKRDQAADHRDRIAGKLTAQQLAKAQRLAREWKPKS